MQAQQNETVSAVLPGRLYKAHTPCTRENDHARITVIIIFERRHRVVIMALHLVFPALRSMAPLLDDLFLFLFLSHPTQNSISGVYLSSGRGRQFSQPYIGEWAGLL